MLLLTVFGKGAAAFPPPVYRIVPAVLQTFVTVPEPMVTVEVELTVNDWLPVTRAGESENWIEPGAQEVETWGLDELDPTNVNMPFVVTCPITPGVVAGTGNDAPVLQVVVPAAEPYVKLPWSSIVPVQGSVVLQVTVVRPVQLAVPVAVQVQLVRS
jgi:hypothetical protein